MKYTAFIPLRGGSKSIPRKNIKDFCGRPLCFWTIEAALKSKVFDKVVVSTEDLEISNVILEYFGASVLIDKRPSSLAKDETSTEDVIIEYIKRSEVEILCLIQATSPLTSSNDFIQAKKLFESSQFDSLVTGTSFKRFLWSKETGKPLNYDFSSRPRRQDFEGEFLENGAFYFSKSELYIKNACRLGGNIALYEMDEINAYELDEPSDWDILSTIFIKKNNEIESFEKKSIKALVLDVDGTLTDGGMFYGPGGEVMKMFNTTDAYGISKLRDSGVKICVITGEDSEAVHARMKKIGIDSSDYFFGIKNKLPILKKWLADNNLTFNDIAYGGDDLGDLDCMKRAYLSFCPLNATPEIKNISKFISSKKGGDGAVRDFINQSLI